MIAALGLASRVRCRATELGKNPRPGLATTNGLFAIISSPYAGVVWDGWRRHYGSASDPLILVAHCTSRTFNPSLSQSVLDRALDRDAAPASASASAEYLAQFRTDVESFISREVVEACVAVGVRERAPLSDQHEHGFR
jgi:hypothetical protein